MDNKLVAWLLVLLSKLKPEVSIKFFHLSYFGKFSILHATAERDRYSAAVARANEVGGGALAESEGAPK